MDAQSLIRDLLLGNTWSLIKYANDALSRDTGNREINPDTTHENKRVGKRFPLWIKLFQKIKLKQN